jgi:hypothetical protein
MPQESLLCVHVLRPLLVVECLCGVRNILVLLCGFHGQEWILWFRILYFLRLHLPLISNRLFVNVGLDLHVGLPRGRFLVEFFLGRASGRRLWAPFLRTPALRRLGRGGALFLPEARVVRILTSTPLSGHLLLLSPIVRILHGRSGPIGLPSLTNQFFPTLRVHFG